MVMVLTVFCFGLPEAEATLVFNDGGVHNIDYLIDDDVLVDYQASGMKTTVNLFDGGRINYMLQALEDSHINISGGKIGGPYFYAYDRSKVNISGGSICYRFYADNNSQVSISGGQFYYLFAHGSSQIDMTGGAFHYDFFAYDTSQIDIVGGRIGFSLYGLNNSNISISGGTIGNHLYARDKSQIDITGGLIGFSLYANNNSQVSISGGLISNELIADNSSVLTIYGSDFAVDGLDFGYGELTSILGGGWNDEPARYLTGTLLSGDLLNNDFYIGHDASIVLIPEPATLLLLGLGAVMVMLKRKGQSL